MTCIWCHVASSENVPKVTYGFTSRLGLGLGLAFECGLALGFGLAHGFGFAPAHPRMCTNGVPLRRFSRELVPELGPELGPELAPRPWSEPGPCPAGVDVDVVESGPEYDAGRDDLNGFGMNWVSVTCPGLGDTGEAEEEEMQPHCCWPCCCSYFASHSM